MQRLDLLVALHEQLFDNAPVPYVQSDTNGRVLRVNAAARRLIRRDLDRQPALTMVNLVHEQDRRTIRTMISQLRSMPRASARPAEVTLVTGEERLVPVVATARRSEDGGSGSPLLHWEFGQVTVDQHADRAAAAVERLAEAAERLAEQQTRAMTLEEVVRQALHALPAADGVGVTLMRPRGEVQTPAATCSLAAASDRLQYDIGEGPCLDAVRTGELVRVPDMAAETRWPRFAPRAAQLGVGSMLVLPLAAARGTSGALNVYARFAHAFDGDDELVGRAYATHAGIALAHVELETNLRTGLATRQEIGQAVGILMERHRINAATAFDLLVQASQQAHVKLRDIAARVVETGQDPTQVI
jgi:putative methionine-R-sulfoxide reductase with GAF domain